MALRRARARLSVRVLVCPKDCLICTLQRGKPWCNPNGCNNTHAYKADDGTCVSKFDFCLATSQPLFYLMSHERQKQVSAGKNATLTILIYNHK